MTVEQTLRDAGAWNYVSGLGICGDDKAFFVYRNGWLVYNACSGYSTLKELKHGDMMSFYVHQAFTLSMPGGNYQAYLGWNNSVPWKEAAVDPLAAAFRISATPGSRTVNFTDESSGSPTKYTWDFGDGSTSSLTNPSHTYSEYGAYTVTLEVERGTESSKFVAVASVSSTDAPTAVLEISTNSIVKGDSVEVDGTGSYASGGHVISESVLRIINEESGQVYQGVSGNGTWKATMDDFNLEGNFIIELEVIQDDGQSSKDSQQLTVVSGSSSTECNPKTVKIYIHNIPVSVKYWDVQMMSDCADEYTYIYSGEADEDDYETFFLLDDSGKLLARFYSAESVVIGRYDEWVDFEDRDSIVLDVTDIVGSSNGDDDDGDDGDDDDGDDGDDDDGNDGDGDIAGLMESMLPMLMMVMMMGMIMPMMGNMGKAEKRPAAARPPKGYVEGPPPTGY